MPNNLRRSIRAIFNPEESYTLTIWFKAPYDVVLFQRNCLGLFTRALAARKPPLYWFVDDFGQKFKISRNNGRKKYFASTEGRDKELKLLDQIDDLLESTIDAIEEHGHSGSS